MKKEFTFCWLILLLIIAATASGLFYHTPGTQLENITVRGQHAIFQGSGLYKYNPLSLVREGIIWDAINLFIGVPIFAFAIFFAMKNTLRGRLLLAGLLVYFWYVFLMYAMMWSFNNLFLVYVLIFSLSMIAFIFIVRHIDVVQLPEQVSGRFPRRLFIGFSIALSAILIFLWLGRIIPIMVTGKFPDELAGLVTLQTQAMDLGFIVPLALSAGILLWRRSPWGYFLSSIAIIFGFMMCITIPAWIVVPLIQDGKVNNAEAAPFLLICITGLVLVVLFYTGIREKKIQDPVINKTN
jgi:hypothetical protein